MTKTSLPFYIMPNIRKILRFMSHSELSILILSKIQKTRINNFLCHFYSFINLYPPARRTRSNYVNKLSPLKVTCFFNFINKILDIANRSSCRIRNIMCRNYFKQIFFLPPFLLHQTCKFLRKYHSPCKNHNQF